jgi:hypothetical protein
MAAITVVGIAAAISAAPPASAEPHANAKQCHDASIAYNFKPIKGPYATSDSSIVIYDTAVWLYSAGNNAAAYGLAYLKAGDYFSIDRTDEKVPISSHYKFFTTLELVEKFRSDFTWQYCEKIRKPGMSPLRSEYDRAPENGWYSTRAIDGAHRGVRLCITRPSVSDKAVCVGADSRPGGWYVDNDDDSNDLT